jgi:hypothetical protein
MEYKSKLLFFLSHAGNRSYDLDNIILPLFAMTLIFRSYIIKDFYRMKFTGEARFILKDREMVPRDHLTSLVS